MTARMSFRVNVPMGGGKGGTTAPATGSTADGTTATGSTAGGSPAPVPAATAAAASPADTSAVPPAPAAPRAEAAEAADPADPADPQHGTGFTVAADRSYAARLSRGGDGRYAERWTLDGPEPYAVPLPGRQSEPAGSQVLPLADGRVLIARPGEEECTFTLLYPTGPQTGELPLGAVPSARVRLLPPAPCGEQAYALVHGPRSTGLWRVVGGERPMPEQLVEIPGHATGGTWLDRDGFLLALDHCAQVPGEDRPAAAGPEQGTGGGKVPPGGPPSGAHAAAVLRAVRAVRHENAASRRARTVKTVVVDLAGDCGVSPLLEITEDSNDRLLAADPDSGLLLVRSDAPGRDRLGWGVLGSTRPLRFPEALHRDGLRLTPLAVQPGEPLLPESCEVALRVDGPDGAWVAVWSPAGGELRHLGAPEGWTGDAAVWSRGGELRLPVSTPAQPCGLARLRSVPPAAPRPAAPAPPGPPAEPANREDGAVPPDEPEYLGPGDGPALAGTGAVPVPLQQAPMSARTA